ncbi:MAG: hypothetical protein SYC29_11090 [Planctomycetota bacterium]|nr:hypothetical protein [Planctomycetota bacterium]
MSEAGGNSNDAPPTSAGEPTELQSTADRVASGVNLLRWALITVFAVNVVSFAGGFVVSALIPDVVGFVWSTFAVRIIAWATAPLALLGVLRILRAGDWPVSRWLLLSPVVYFAADSVLTPANSVHTLLWRLDIEGGVMPAVDVGLTIISGLLSLLYFAVLFAGFHLAGAVDGRFGGSLISARHRTWLLWVGIVLQCIMLTWWAVLRFWDPVALAVGDDDITYGAVTSLLSGLLVLLPGLAWLIWLFVVASRIRRKLDRFAKRSRCPRCDYYLHDRTDAGCPECGWMRGPEYAGAAGTV